MNYEIKPYIGFDNVKFGMQQNEIRSLINTPFESFKKTQNSEMETDAFRNHSIHVFYKKPGLCEAIEFYSPSCPLFQGKKIIGQPFDQISNWLKEIDVEVDIEEAGFTSYKFGFAVYAPSCIENPTDPIEALLIFEKGYYD